MEGASGAVEFLSVECDMIFEPECDLETECHEEGEEGDRAASPSSHTPSPSPSRPHTPPRVDELFRGRNVGVYRRSDPSEAFVLIYDPTLEAPGVEDIKGIGSVGRERSSPEEGGEEGSDDEEGQGQQCRLPVRCSVCRKQFHSRGHLVTHGLTHILPSPGPPPPCPVCGASLPSRAALKIHVRRHFSVRTYQCPACQQCHLTRTQLMMHQQIHGTPRHHHHQAASPHTPAYAPTQCQAQEETRAPPEHQTKVPPPKEKSHSPEPDLRCEHCSANFTTRSALHSHRKSHRERRRRHRRRHECPECGSQFWRSSALKKHRRAEHDM